MGWTISRKKPKMRKYNFGHLCSSGFGFLCSPRGIVQVRPNSSNANRAGITRANCECFFLLMMQRWAELNEEKREREKISQPPRAHSHSLSCPILPSFLPSSFPLSLQALIIFLTLCRAFLGTGGGIQPRGAKYSIEYQCMKRNLILSRSGSQCESGSSSLP